MTGWTVAKYACAVAGIALVLAADRSEVAWLGYPGLGLLVVAFLLRFPQKKAMRRAQSPTE